MLIHRKDLKEFLEEKLSRSINSNLGYHIPNMTNNYIFKSRERAIGKLNLNQKSDREIEITDISENKKILLY